MKGEKSVEICEKILEKSHIMMYIRYVTHYIWENIPFN